MDAAEFAQLRGNKVQCPVCKLWVTSLDGHRDLCAGIDRSAPDVRVSMAVQFTADDAGLCAMVASAESLARQLMHTMTADELGRLRGIIEGWRGPRRRTVLVGAFAGAWDTGKPTRDLIGLYHGSARPSAIADGVKALARVELEEGRFDE